NRDIILQFENLSGDDHQAQYHSKTGENRTSYKVRREDGSMPTWNHRRGKVKRYNGVNRKYKRSGQTCKDQRNCFITHPRFSGTVPAHTQSSVDRLSDPGSPVSDGCKVRDQTDKPKH